MILKGLSIGYKHSAPVVSAIDAELSIGTFCCLLGRNGSGKSTLLRTIARLQPPLSGQVICSEHVGIVLTQVPELQHTTVRQMIAFGRLGTTDWLGRLRQEDYDAADEAIRTVGIQPLADRLLGTLSDGEKQKTMIARAIAQASPLLLLDEPSAFLDYPSRHELMQVLQRLAHQQGKTILLSTHDVELALTHADHLWLLKEGHLQQFAPQDFSADML